MYNGIATNTKKPAFALELQAPWASLIASGAKKIETRSYVLPPEIVGQEVVLLETKASIDCKSALPDQLTGIEAAERGVRIAGKVIFGPSFPYPDAQAWEADEARHRVAKDSPYGWAGAAAHNKTPIHAWPVVRVIPGEVAEAPLPTIHRVRRSIFAIIENNNAMPATTSPVPPVAPPCEPG